jgi:hypothetical protein
LIRIKSHLWHRISMIISTDTMWRDTLPTFLALKKRSDWESNTHLLELFFVTLNIGSNILNNAENKLASRSSSCHKRNPGVANRLIWIWVINKRGRIKGKVNDVTYVYFRANRPIYDLSKFMSSHFHVNSHAWRVSSWKVQLNRLKQITNKKKKIPYVSMSHGSNDEKTSLLTGWPRSQRWRASARERPTDPLCGATAAARGPRSYLRQLAARLPLCVYTAAWGALQAMRFFSRIKSYLTISFLSVSSS